MRKASTFACVLSLLLNASASTETLPYLVDGLARGPGAIDVSQIAPAHIAQNARASSQQPPATPSVTGGPIWIPMKIEGATYVVPVIVNDAITLPFVLDTGASDVSIPADVVLTLVRTGTLEDGDFIGTQNYNLADGSTVPSARFWIRSLTVGNRKIENVTGSVAPVAGHLLLGQSFLSRFKSWSIDNEKGATGARPAANRHA